MFRQEFFNDSEYILASYCNIEGIVVVVRIIRSRKPCRAPVRELIKKCDDSHLNTPAPQS